MAPFNIFSRPGVTLGQRSKKGPEMVVREQSRSNTQSPERHGTNRLDQWFDGMTEASPAGWKPYTMRAPVLCAVVLISLGLAGVTEYLAQKSLKQGGLALSPSQDAIPQSVNIAYLYLPTTVAVLYSLLWTWIDLDVRRMQPWFELSRSHGANGDQSLLLNYPFEFLAFVPITAWKQRHWPVFIAGTVMMLVFWAITPLQGAIFGKQAVVLTRSAAMSIRSGLIPVEEQAAAFDVSILNTAYGITWYNQDLPDFTTAEYALLPFSPTENVALGVNETWTFNTTRFKTDLNCWSATYTENTVSAGGGQYLFDNGQGCSQNISISGGKEDYYNLQYIGWATDAHLDWALHNQECGSAFAHQFIAIVGQGTGNGSNAKFGNITAMFCEPSYMKQEVSIAVDAATAQPLNDSLVELASWTQLDDTTFNSSAFEFLLHAGFSSVVIDRDYPDNLILNQYAKMYDLNVWWPVTNMVGFAIGLHNGSLADFLDTSVLRETYATAHKLIFSSAFSQIISQTEEPGTRSGLVKYTMYGIVISRPFSIAVECLLAIVAILTAFLLYTISRSQSNLSSDPDSVASLLGMAQQDETMLCHLSNMDNLSETSLRARISSDRQDSDINDDPDNTTTITDHAQIQSIRPKELRPIVGVLLVLALSSAIGILGYLKHQEMLLNGLARPSQNFEVLQLLENYIPMAFSTLLEPFLTLLNRLLCVLQPYQDLIKGRRSPRTTIEKKYDSLPPQLMIWRAAKAGHYFLALLSLVVLLANVLAVGLGAIFNESPVSMFTSLNVTTLKLPTVSRDTVLLDGLTDKGVIPYYDHFYMVQTNLSANTSLPPWIDAQFAYLPFSDFSSNGNSSLQYAAVTQGFGLTTSCSTISTNNASLNRIEYTYNTTGLPAAKNAIKAVFEDTPYGNTTICMLPGVVDTRGIGSLNTVPNGRSAHEVYSYLEQEDAWSYYNATAEELAFCESRVVLGWMRYDTSQAESSPNMTFLQCTSQMLTAHFNVTVDADGHILYSERVGEYGNITEVLGPNATAVSLDANMLIGDKWHTTSSDSNYLGWHNDSHPRDWMNYYLKLATNSTDLVDADKPLPDATSLIPLIEEIYQRIGAALLGANLDLFTDSLQTRPTLSATSVAQDTRIFMDNTAFIISMTILGIYLVVGIMFYARQRKILLPRMPSTIGSTVAFAAGSRAIRMYRGAEEKGQYKDTYSFGKYVGVDGKAHIGIELDPYVMEPQVFYLVCYNDKDPSEEIKKRHTFLPALLHGYCRRRVRSAAYPGMTEEAGHSVRGAVVTGLTKDNLERLDYFEGSSYDRRVVRPKLLTQVGNDKGEGNVEGEQVITESYIFLDEKSLEDKEWDFQEFRRDKLKQWTRAGYVFEDCDPDDVATVSAGV
ncbi:Protein AIG2 [Cytospora mali]|uniref:Protein AIG2 n=1 Tax=Cytospora mali TaxID=578113 RepID=A0A194W578_CYTMA|nr:Protein AIG2 [Valsa mali]